ncbi:alpha/beta hydrolase [Rhodococcus sp. NPDC004095]
MNEPTAFTLDGHAGVLAAGRTSGANPRYLALVCHGYGEHCGRYGHLAERLVADGAAVYALDHAGHGLSAGERVLIDDVERIVEDFRLLEDVARWEHPDLPVVLIGHSMGGMIAARFAQRFGDGLAAVVLSAPVLGRWDVVDTLLAADEIPNTPIDPATLSRDPRVGEAYLADPLVWHGPFRRPTLEALRRGLDTINEAGAVDTVPVLWMHGTDDGLVPREGTAEGWERLAGKDSRYVSYPGARHEILNETNRDEVVDDLLAFVHDVL